MTGRFGFMAAGLLAMSLGAMSLGAASLNACTTGAPASAPEPPPEPPPEPSQVRQVVSTTSFGMCVGYCSTRLEISESGAVLTRSSGGGRGGANLPDQRFTATLPAGEWEAIAHLAANTSLTGLPEVIGCPDCADGGAETLQILAAHERTITFEYGAQIEQARSLLERVRALRARLTPE